MCPVSYDLTTGGLYPVPATPLGIAQGGAAPVLQPLIQFKMTLQDTYASNVTFAGKVAPVVGGVLQPAIVMTGSPIALPAVPGAGSVFWALQVNLATGLVTMKQSTSAPPTADAGNLIIVQHKVSVSDTVPWGAGAANATTAGGVAPSFVDLN